MEGKKGISTPKLIIILAIILLIVVAVVVLIPNLQQIKKGTVVNELTFKENIPKIKSKSDPYIVIEDPSGQSYYQIMLISGWGSTEPFVVVSVTNGSRRADSYWYAWEKGAKATGGALAVGWNVQDDRYLYTPIDSFPFSISGTVINSSGNTAVFRKILNF